MSGTMQIFYENGNHIGVRATSAEEMLRHAVVTRGNVVAMMWLPEKEEDIGFNMEGCRYWTREGGELEETIDNDPYVRMQPFNKRVRELQGLE